VTRQQDSKRAGARSRPVGAWRVMVTLASITALVAAGSAQASYTVQPGDSLGQIAQRHGTSVAALMDQNGVTDPHRIVAGDTLVIPEGAPGGSGATHHVVRPGETPAVIARRYGISSAELLAWNGLPDESSLWSGSRLSVSGPASPNLASSVARDHRVVAGESLSGIAARYGVRIATLAADNQIADPNRIAAGTTLTISDGWHCPVRGEVRFINDYGITKPSGRFHNGVDLYAARGTAVIAPVSGYVQQLEGVRAGLQVTLSGADGHSYIGTHLDSFGVSGQVQAGEVIGTVGSSGNARGTPPHLHFEIHLGGARIIDPYPSLRAACS
jgi:murein DD-endopeptidase MepM/ murein hydrolase activator NlpD